MKRLAVFLLFVACFASRAVAFGFAPSTASRPPNALGNTTAFTYDAANRRTSQTERHGSGTFETTSYTYDEAGQLLEAAYPDGTTTAYTYDEAGNRIRETVTDPNGTQTADKLYAYDSFNQLTNIDDSVTGTQTAYAFDANGNQTGKTVTTGGSSTETGFTYTSRDRLAEVTTGGSVAASFDYDDAGRRIRKNSATEGSAFAVWDGRSLVAETDVSTGGVIRSYTHGLDLIRENVLGQVTEAYTDVLGSVGALMPEGQTAGMASHFRYDAFGGFRTTAHPGGDCSSQPNALACNAPLTYTGHLYDPESGLFYFGARYYDPETGRFLTNDPVAGDALNPPSLHRYLYAYSSPMTYVDPWGEEIDPFFNTKHQLETMGITRPAPVEKVGPFVIRARVNDKGEVIGYVAASDITGHWMDYYLLDTTTDLAQFKRNIDSYGSDSIMNAAEKTQQEPEWAREYGYSTYMAMRGHGWEALKSFGRQWLLAVKDPHWWMMALPATLAPFLGPASESGAVIDGEGGEIRPVTNPAGEVPATSDIATEGRASQSPANSPRVSEGAASNREYISNETTEEAAGRRGRYRWFRRTKTGKWQDANNQWASNEAVEQHLTPELKKLYDLEGPGGTRAVRILPGKSSKIVVLGRNQGTVDTYAQELRDKGYDVVTFSGDQVPKSADYSFKKFVRQRRAAEGSSYRLTPEEVRSTDLYKEDIRWTKEAKASGATFVDIGPGHGGTSSPFLNGEYREVFTKTGGPK